MKTEEEILNKLTQMKEGFETYINNFNSTIKVNYFNGLPQELEKDTIYNIVKSQIEALEWVLKDSRRK